MRYAPIGEPARFRPTWLQVVGRGLYFGVLVAAALVGAVLIVVLVNAWVDPPFVPAWWVWPSVTISPPALGVLAGVSMRRRLGAVVDAAGIGNVSAFTGAVQPWSQVVDLRAERRGSRTVVAVYLESGASVRLRAPYDGELFAGDPMFELKVSALSHLWRSHRFGGLA